jgi:hypothetical protein
MRLYAWLNGAWRAAIMGTVPSRYSSAAGNAGFTGHQKPCYRMGSDAVRELPDSVEGKVLLDFGGGAVSSARRRERGRRGAGARRRWQVQLWLAGDVYPGGGPGWSGPSFDQVA